METDPTATFASSNWIRQPIQLEPFHQLGGVLPAKRQNTEFLDESNTWLITSTPDYRPAEFQLPGAYSSNVRPPYLRRPGEYPTSCPLEAQAALRKAIEEQEKQRAGPATPTMTQAGAADLSAVATLLPADVAQLRGLIQPTSRLWPTIAGLVGVALIVVLLLQQQRKRK